MSDSSETESDRTTGAGTCEMPAGDKYIVTDSPHGPITWLLMDVPAAASTSQIPLAVPLSTEPGRIKAVPVHQLVDSWKATGLQYTPHIENLQFNFGIPLGGEKEFREQQKRMKIYLSNPANRILSPSPSPPTETDEEDEQEEQDEPLDLSMRPSQQIKKTTTRTKF